MTDLRFTNDIVAAAAAIRAGELVAFPTETVYGLGADATSQTALRKIFTAKGRPADHPLIVHFSSIPAAQKWAFSWNISENLLANTFWPGPMTLIVKRASHVSDAVTGGQDTVGLRVPSHPVALALLRAAGVPIAAPSANKFGHVSPTRAQHVASEFGDELQTILVGADADECEVGVESTIIDCTVSPVRILRPGRISAADIERVLGFAPQTNMKSESAPRVSGSLASHYAPRTRTLLKNAQTFSAVQVTGKIGTLTFTVIPNFAGTHLTKMKIPAAQIEHDLYADLRELDAAGLDEIWVEAPPMGEAWEAVWDRVSRASVRERIPEFVTFTHARLAAVNLRIRHAEASDEPFVYATRVAAMRAHIEKKWGWDEKLQQQFHRHRWLAKNWFLICEHNLPIGTFCLDRSGSNLQFGEFYLAPPHQRRGIGSHILTTSLAFADSFSLTTHLEYLKWNPVNTLYARHGFVPVHESDTHVFLSRTQRLID